MRRGSSGCLSDLRDALWVFQEEHSDIISHGANCSFSCLYLLMVYGLPWWLRQLRIHLQCERPGFDPWVGKIPWRRKWQLTPVFLPGESHGQRSLAGYSPWGQKEWDMTEWLSKRHINGLDCLAIITSSVWFSSVTVVSNSLRPHEPQHARFPCPSPIPGAYSNSCPLSQWCYPTISSSVIHFSSWLQSFPASGSFTMSQFFTSGGQSITILELQLEHQSFQWIFMTDFP